MQIIGQQQRRARIIAQRVEPDLASALPAPRPDIDAWITTGPPNFSTPVVMASACRRCTYSSALKVPLRSLVRASAYSVPVFRSIPGVEVTPTSGVMNGQSTSRAGTGVTPASGCAKRTLHNGRKSFRRHRTRKRCRARWRHTLRCARPCPGLPLPADREAAHKWARPPERRRPCQTALR